MTDAGKVKSYTKTGENVCTEKKIRKESRVVSFRTHVRRHEFDFYHSRWDAASHLQIMELSLEIYIWRRIDQLCRGDYERRSGNTRMVKSYTRRVYRFWSAISQRDGNRLRKGSAFVGNNVTSAGENL